jgi:hypothetical protein
MSNQELAAALSRVHQLAKKYGGSIVISFDLDRADRELLVRNHWLQEIIRGWYMFTRPDVLPGESSPWYANFWDFVQYYLKETVGSDYCLSAENSIDVHIANPTIPKQLIVIVKKGGSNVINLPFNTSILIYPDANNFPPEKTTIRGIEAMTLPYALCKATPTYFQKNEINLRIALESVRDIQEFIRVIAEYNFVRAGERIIGAYQALNEMEKAETIKDQLKIAGMNLKGTNPFEDIPTVSAVGTFRSVYQGRIKSLWDSYRSVIIQHFPPPPGIPKNKEAYIHKIEEQYKKDAYNSLSIEGYQVDADLIERVMNNHWNPDLHPEDQHERNALAARGYYEAFIEVKKAILQIVNGENPGNIIEKQLQNWFQKLFAPNVHARILKPTDLFGYRKHQVYIRGSRHVPFPREALLDSMEAFFDCLKREEHPAVRAILGHFIFVYIHPFMDGNGRLSRFIMNAMFASGGYPWNIIEVKNRDRYFAALESASVGQDILPFTLFVAGK